MRAKERKYDPPPTSPLRPYIYSYSASRTADGAYSAFPSPRSLRLKCRVNLCTPEMNPFFDRSWALLGIRSGLAHGVVAMGRAGAG